MKNAAIGNIDHSGIEALRKERELPKGWSWHCLVDVAKWGSSGTPSRSHPEYNNGTIPWIKTGELGNGDITGTEEHISEEALADSSA